jgi:hypothetical protein
VLALGLTAAVAALWEGDADAGAARLARPRSTDRPLSARRRRGRGRRARLYPLYVLAGGNNLQLRAEWLWLAIGLFAYHGLAEELTWRGYAFRRLRQGRSFGGAIRWTMPLIAITHLPILGRMT